MRAGLLNTLFNFPSIEVSQIVSVEVIVRGGRFFHSSSCVWVNEVNLSISHKPTVSKGKHKVFLSQVNTTGYKDKYFVLDSKQANAASISSQDRGIKQHVKHSRVPVKCDYKQDRHPIPQATATYINLH